MNVVGSHGSGAPRWFAKVLAVGAILITGCLSTPSVAQRASDHDRQAVTPFADPSTLDSSIRSPGDFVGHVIGDGAVRHAEVVAYLKYLAEASPYVSLHKYAETHEGRGLYYATITSAENQANLGRIKADNQRLADPRMLQDEAEAKRLMDSMPGIAWLAYCIHGDELSSTDAALMVAYRLAAGTDEDTKQLRDQLVIHIDPLQNPDGRERYLNQLQQLSGKVSNFDYQAMQHNGLWSAGRWNHYLFDMNRDWVPLVQPETRGRAKAILEWNPQLLVDSHEMGPLDTYLFDPPRAPFNVELSKTVLDWRRRFSQDQAAALDQHGWSYYTREWYEEWYPGYTNSWANVQGTIGLLYEQASVDGSAVTQQSGRLLTFREAVHHQYVSSFANLETLRRHRRELIEDYHKDRVWAVAPERSGKDAFLVVPSDDEAKLARLTSLLDGQGIEYSFAEDAFNADGVTDLWGDSKPQQQFPAGTLVVRAAQPRRRLLRAILDFDPHMTDEFLLRERQDLERHEGTRLYDTTAWNVAMAYDLDAYWVKDADAVATRAAHAAPAQSALDDARYGYVIDGASSDVFGAIAKLTADGYHVRVATKPFHMSDRAFSPGSLLIRRQENDEGLESVVADLRKTLALEVAPLTSARAEAGPDLGGPRFPMLAEPKVAIASQWPVAPTSFGATWYLLDNRLRERVSPVNIQSLGRLDLRRYNVLILPNVWSSSALRGVLNAGAISELKSWVEAGGTLIAYGGSAAYLASEDQHFGSVRLKRNVLDQLDVYHEALERELAAREVHVDPGEVWGGAATEAPADAHEGDNEAKEKDSEEEHGHGDSDARKRLDEWQRVFSPEGPIVGAILDAQQFLAFGLSGDDESPHRLPVLINGSYALMAKYPVGVPARLMSADRLRLSGLMWPEARKRWSGTAYATVESMGRGQVILFAADPFFRGHFQGTGRMLLNAVFLGPGVGASQPIPW